jgi:acyl phosphate:glycerol-3-phosphate acyltransferase
MNLPPQLVDPLLLATAYSLGCLSAGYYLVRFQTGTDIRLTGSRSTGATNVARFLGRRAFLGTLLWDAGKGALAVALPRLAQSDSMIAAWAMTAVVAGHIWPVQLRFHGGKGFATFLGAILCLDPRAGLVLAALALILHGFLRAYKLAGLGAVLFAPLAAWSFQLHPATIAALALTAPMILIAHRGNIREEIGNLMPPRKPGDKHRPAARP